MRDTVIRKAGVINNWNLDRGIAQQDDRTVTWKAVTTGNYGAIDLWLQDRSGRLAFTTKPVAAEVALADIGIEAKVFAAGGLERAVTLQRLPDVMTTMRVVHETKVKVRRQGDTRLYVRVQQEDGHRAWSSPIYLFRK